MYRHLPNRIGLLLAGLATLTATGCTAGPPSRETPPRPDPEIVKALETDAGSVALAIEVYAAKTGQYPQATSTALAAAFAELTTGPNQVRDYSVSQDKPGFRLCVVNPVTRSWLRWDSTGSTSGEVDESGIAPDEAGLIEACQRR